ncbi:MAG: phosphatidylglycerol lysyltransferase domain-containing protein [Oscillospiraceae bacterium]|nr:phosphatidylglycerol lysyltransferase domain-containing protein [Oscillospiraceae bacterium]
MLEFRILQLSDREWVQRALDRSGFWGCEYSFANNLAWRRAADTKFARFENFYICASFDTKEGVPEFYYPAGGGDIRRVFREIAETAVSMKVPMQVIGVTEQSLDVLKDIYGGMFTAEPYPDGFDYIYETRDLTELPGKKYHKKRGHLAQFRKNYENYSFSGITPEDYDECIAMSARFYNEKHGYTDRSSVAEQFAIHTYFSNFEELQLKGGVLRVNGELAGFSIGERLTDDMFVTHIEKADIKYKGVYTALMQAFTAEFAAGYRYINREEDLGIEGLRKAKRACQPAFMLKKYCCTFPEPEKLL